MNSTLDYQFKVTLGGVIMCKNKGGEDHLLLHLEFQLTMSIIFSPSNMLSKLKGGNIVDKLLAKLQV